MNDLAVTILLCYSDKDRSMVDDLKSHLRPLENDKRITLWDHSNITPGADREEEMDKHLDEAQIILLQVSASFLASSHSVMQRAIERHERKEARVIPVILRPAMWEITPLNKLRPLPDNEKPIAEWPNRDKGYKNVAVGIFKVIAEQEALSLPGERKTLKANLDQLIETVMSQMSPEEPDRAEALIYTLQQSRMIIPNEVTFPDLVEGWRTLSHSSKKDEEPKIKQRRETCRELTNMASRFTTGQGSLTQAIKTWRIWTEAFKKGASDPRQAAMANTFSRELTELKEVAANP